MKNNGSAHSTSLGQAKIVVILIVLAVVLGVGYVVVTGKIRMPAQTEQLESRVVQTNNGSERTERDIVYVIGNTVAGWQIYSNEEYGYEVQYPSGWDKRGGSPSSDFYNPRFVNFGTDGQITRDYRVLSVRVRDDKRYPSLDGFVADAQKELELMSETPPIKIEVFKEKDVRIGSYTGILREEFVHGDVVQVVRFLKDELAFEISLTGDYGEPLTDEDSLLFDTFVSSFKLVE